MNSNQIKSGSLISYFLIGLNIILGLFYTPWILKEVGSSNYGLYTLASSLIAIFLMDFGMSAAVSRFVSNFRAKNDYKAINSFVGIAIKFYIIICSIIAIILFILYFNIDKIYSNLTIQEIGNFKVVYIITAFFVVTCYPVNICNGILNAFEQFILLKGTEVINKIGSVVITVVVLLLHGGIYELVFINGFFNLLAFIVKAVAVKKRTTVKVSFEKSTDVSFREIFSFASWTMVYTISGQMIFNMIPSVLAMVANTFAITLYGFANTIEGYVFTISDAINGLFMPSVSRVIVNDKDASKILSLMIKVGRINQSIMTLLLIGLTVLGKEFVNLWIGEGYSQLFYCILLLSWPYYISASQQIANTSITVLNKVKYSALINVFAGVLNLILSYFVCKKFGVVGVCTVTGIVFLIRIIMLNIVYKSVLKIDILMFFRKCQIQLLPAGLITFAISFVLNRFSPSVGSGLSGWLFLMIKAIIVFGIFFIVMWIIGWNEDEKYLMKGVLKDCRK